MARTPRKHKGLKTFAKRFGGTLIAPEDLTFDEARALHNGMIDKRPGLIAQCTTPADVSLAITYAREVDMEIAVRSGGHSVAGMSTTAGGIVIDVRPMREIAVDPVERIARVGAGATWAQFDRAAQLHGLAVTGGRVSTTGVAGFTLGGGSGWIERAHGLACDNVRAVEYVLADGSIVRADDEQHDELLWASRGGGGNYGVATAFEFDLHPVGPIVYAGLMMWPAATGPDVAHLYRDYHTTAPDELGSALVFLTGPPEQFVPPHLQGQPVCAVVVCYIGPLEDGESLMAPFRALVPEVDLVQAMPYYEFQSMLDDPPGLRNYWSAAFVGGLPDDAIAMFVKSSADARSPLTQNILMPWGGAVAHPARPGPMVQRDARWVYHPFAVWESPADDDANIAWARDAVADMSQWCSSGTYLNFIGDEGEDRIAAAFGPNYSKLRTIKWRYDHDNVFHLNQNIKP